MKTSNLVFFSNIYVLNGHGKVSDPEFMAHVTDPGALTALVEGTRMSGSVQLEGVQKRIFENSKPCAYSDGDYTHGSVIENGKIVCVNKCENTRCKLYGECSKQSDFRKVIRDPDATFDFVENEEKEEEFKFDILLPGSKTSKSIFIKKVSYKPLHLTKEQPEIDEIIRTNKTEEWGVRPHIRHLPDGSTTWVRGHRRKHIEPISISYAIRKPASSGPVIKKNFVNIKLLKRLAKKAEEKQVAVALSSQVYQLKNIKPIDSADIIIKSSLEDKILVNAGPGTGKTHTVIERLKYIATNYDDVDPENILVLCFSRSAVKVIRDRLSKSMESGEIPYIAKRFNILTFDSFATYYLKQIEPRYDLTFYSYDARIESFTEKYRNDPSLLAVEYLIVDEVQDLVGKRAEMVRALLENMECGFLLLGDECQAIYDYQITGSNELNAAKLYEWLEAHFRDDLAEYELTKEWRHSGALEEEFKPLRNAMLYSSYDTQEKRLLNVFDKHGVKGTVTDNKVFDEKAAFGKRAVLSWANGDAYRLSQDLYNSDDVSIKHTILTGSRRLLFRKELALIFGDFQNKFIDKVKFFQIGKERNVDEKRLNKIWDAILVALDSDGDEISLDFLKKALLAEKRVGEDLLTSEDADVVISTIHKAKGKEYDTVVLNKFGKIDNADDIKVYYVALTRTKNELIVKANGRSYSHDVKTNEGRFIELNKLNEIKRVELGIDGDIDTTGFVSKRVPGLSPKDRQKYILDKVKVGDPIKISRQNESYYIVHDGHIIGEMNKNILNPYKHYFPSGKSFTFYFDKYTDYVDLFVKDIVSIVNQRLDENIPEPYKGSGFWFGVEFCGYAKPMEE